MPASRPSSLPENAGLAFIGESDWPAARLTSREAKLFALAQNPSGRPNGDVLRSFIGLIAGEITERPQIDFPAHFTEQEAALYRDPFAKLGARHNTGESTKGVSKRTTPPTAEPSWWISPHTKAGLRTALARLERYLATPVAAKIPVWDWIDSQTLPDGTLLAVARDDDFTAGILKSRSFHCWWSRNSAQLSPAEIVSSFPFPWPPTTQLSALNRTQEEQRHALARAARSENQEQIDSAACTAYGWSHDLTDEEIVARLTKLNYAKS